MPAKSEVLYARLVAAKDHSMLAVELRSALGLTSDQLNHLGDRLKRIGAVTVTKEGTGRYRWTAKPGVNVADRRGLNRVGVCSPHSLANLRKTSEQERDRLLRERARQDAMRPIRDRLRLPLDIAWYNWHASMKTGDHVL